MVYTYKYKSYKVTNSEYKVLFKRYNYVGKKLNLYNIYVPRLKILPDNYYQLGGKL